MKNILVVSGHPNPSASLANKTILESLRTAFPQAQLYLDYGYKNPA